MIHVSYKLKYLCTIISSIRYDRQTCIHTHKEALGRLGHFCFYIRFFAWAMSNYCNYGTKSAFNRRFLYCALKQCLLREIFSCTQHTTIVFLLFSSWLHAAVLMKSVPILVGGTDLQFRDFNLHFPHKVILGERILVPDLYAHNVIHCEGALKTDLKIFLPPWKPSLVYYLATQ